MNVGSSGGYRVVYLNHVLDLVRDWLIRAGPLGLRPLLDAALATIHNRLLSTPSNWGNPDKVYQHLGMQMRKAAEWGIVLSFGVDEVNRLVCVNRIRLLRSNPLFQGP